MEGRKWRRSAKQNITAHRCEHLLWNAHQPRSLGQHGGVKPLAATAKPLKGDALTSVAVSAAEFRSEILSSRLPYRRDFLPPEDSSSTYRVCKVGDDSFLTAYQLLKHRAWWLFLRLPLHHQINSINDFTGRDVARIGTTFLADIQDDFIRRALTKHLNKRFDRTLNFSVDKLSKNLEEIIF